MNCKEGDLAIVVSAKNPENLGRIVTCRKFLGYTTNVPTQCGGTIWMTTPRMDMWEVEGTILWGSTNALTGKKKYFELPYVYDSHLRPITPPDSMKDEEVAECSAPVAEVL